MTDILTPAERKVLNLYLLVSTPKADLTNNPLYRGLQRRGLLSVQPMQGDRTRARVMTTALGEYFSDVTATDCHDYGTGYPVHDFLMPYLPDAMQDRPPEWIITNPPFNHAQSFVERALQIATDGVAVLVRTTWMEGITRYNELFSRTPPYMVAPFAERVIMHKGKMLDPEKLYLDERTGEMKRPSTATSYAWFLFSPVDVRHETILRWIPPCRKRLERPGDYDVVGVG